MLPRVRTILLLGLPLLFSLGVDAAAQVGRLVGNVAYATPVRPTPARGVIVVAVDGNQQGWQTRTDNNGNFVLVLRVGSYRVVAQGAPGYTTYGDVRGYVRAGYDSVITPNPLFLVASSRSSVNVMTRPMLSQMATWRGHTLTAQENKITPVTAAQDRGNGKLSGRVLYKRSNKPARGVVVVAVDGNQQGWQTRTDNNGNFVLVLRAGGYRVVAPDTSGYTTEKEGWGYVNAKDDNSVITPNPLYLVPSHPPSR